MYMFIFCILSLYLYLIFAHLHKQLFAPNPSNLEAPATVK